MCGKVFPGSLGGVNGLTSKNWISRMGAYASDTCSRHTFVSLRCFGSFYGRHTHQCDSRHRASGGGLHATRSRLQRIPATLGYCVCCAISLSIPSRSFRYISGPSLRNSVLSHHLPRPAPCLTTTNMLPYLRCSLPSQSNDCDRYPPYGLGGSATKSTCLN